MFFKLIEIDTNTDYRNYRLVFYIDDKIKQLVRSGVNHVTTFQYSSDSNNFEFYKEIDENALLSSMNELDELF
jgi:hypothetical protein